MCSQVYLHLTFTIILDIALALLIYVVASLLTLGRVWGVLAALYFWTGKMDQVVLNSIGPRGARQRMHGWAKRAMRVVLALMVGKAVFDVWSFGMHAGDVERAFGAPAVLATGQQL